MSEQTVDLASMTIKELFDLYNAEMSAQSKKIDSGVRANYQLAEDCFDELDKKCRVLKRRILSRQGLMYTFNYEAKTLSVGIPLVIE